MSITSQLNVSVIVVNYNSYPTLNDCIKSILASKSFGELLLVDNASTDKSLDLIKEYDDIRLKIIRLNQNMGLAGARNMAVAKAGGQYIAFTDSDAVVDPEWLQEPCFLLKKYEEIGSVQCKNLSVKYPNKISFAGAGEENFNWESMPKEKLNYVRPILYPIGASIIVRRDVFSLVKGFDSDYFVGHDDIDFGIRLWLRGYKVVCSSKGIVYHDGGHLRSQKIIAPIFQYYNIKNNLVLWAKILQTRTIIKYVLPFLLPYAFRAFWLDGVTGIRAVFGFFKEFPSLLVKRYDVQRTRRIPDKKILVMLRKSDVLPVFMFTQDFRNLLILIRLAVRKLIH